MQNTPEREIDLMRLLAALWRRAWAIVLCILIGGLAAFLITRYMITPMYRANVSIYVDNSTSTEESENYISGSSLSTAQRLVETYVTIIQSDTVLQQVIDEHELNMTPSQLRSMMSASSVNETEIFRVYISCDDPQEAAMLANAIADVVPAQINSFLTGSSAKIIDYAKVPTSPYTPNYQRNIVLGAVIGAVLAIAAICIATILDNRIEDEEGLERTFERPVLGSIPAFETAAKSGDHYGYGKKYGYPGQSKEGHL